jgi:hypothetical protein
MTSIRSIGYNLIDSVILQVFDRATIKRLLTAVLTNGKLGPVTVDAVVASEKRLKTLGVALRHHRGCLWFDPGPQD